MILKRILHPNGRGWLILPLLSFAALIFIFANGKTEGVPAYLIYSVSAYSFAVLCLAAPNWVKAILKKLGNSRMMKRIFSSEMVDRYRSDLAFRGNISIYQGMTVNFLYMLFRAVTGIYYASAWFISMAAYYLFLGGIRAYLIVCYRRRHERDEMRCYRNTARLLFLLNVPVGGMILLMVRTDSGFSYSGYVVYLSALHTFYTLILAVRNIVKFRRVGSPILSAAKVLNFIAAMMSILGLQTALISQFSDKGEDYRKMMNAITGGCIYAIVLAIAVYMLLHSRRAKGRKRTIGQSLRQSFEDNDREGSGSI